MCKNNSVYFWTSVRTIYKDPCTTRLLYFQA